MRRLLLVAVVGWLVVAPAGPAAARTAKQPPIEIRSWGPTEGMLKDRGFMVSVLWRVARHQDVVVSDSGGGPADPLERIHQIETAVWTFEPIRFDRLVIENRTGSQTRFTVAYEDLQASLGSRAAGLDKVTPGALIAVSAVFGAPSADGSRNDSSSWLLIPGVVLGPLALVILLVALTVIRGRRRSGDASAHRLAG